MTTETHRRYYIRAVTPEQTLFVGEIEAGDETSAADLLRQRGYRLLELSSRPLRSAGLQQDLTLPGADRLSLVEAERLCRELGQLHAAETSGGSRQSRTSPRLLAVACPLGVRFPVSCRSSCRPRGGGAVGRSGECSASVGGKLRPTARLSWRVCSAVTLYWALATPRGPRSRQRKLAPRLERSDPALRVPYRGAPRPLHHQRHRGSELQAQTSRPGQGPFSNRRGRH